LLLAILFMSRHWLAKRYRQAEHLIKR